MTALIKTFKNVIFIALIGIISFVISGVILKLFVGIDADLRIIVSYSVPIILMLIGVTIYDRLACRRVQPTMWSIRGLDPMRMLCNVLLLVSVSIVLSPLMRLLPAVNQDVPNGVWAVVTMVFVAPIFEELLFRSKVFSIFRSYLSPSLSAVMTSAIFAAMHGELAVAIEAFIAGMIFSYAYIASKSILAPMMLHIFNNIIAYVLINFEYQDRTIVDYIGALQFFDIIYAISFIIMIIGFIMLFTTFRRSDRIARGYIQVDN